MASPLTLTRVWRILKEVDLEAIRREAGRRVRVLVIGEDAADADSLAIRLAEGGGDPTRWLTAIDAPLAAPTVGAAGAAGANRSWTAPTSSSRSSRAPASRMR